MANAVVLFIAPLSTYVRTVKRKNIIKDVLSRNEKEYFSLMRFESINMVIKDDYIAYCCLACLICLNGRRRNVLVLVLVLLSTSSS